jgi:thiosulfate/3-mercaptopyruvate sulfurtransferase
MVERSFAAIITEAESAARSKSTAAARAMPPARAAAKRWGAAAIRNASAALAWAALAVALLARGEAAAQPASPIVTVDWLGQALARPEPPALVDVRDAFAYRASHVAGSANADSSEFLATVDGVPGMTPPPEALTALARRLGIRRDRPVVFYGDATEPFAARSALEFRLAGHPSALWLDGGIQAAAQAHLPMETASPETPPGDFVASRPEAGVADGAWVASHLRDGAVALVDTRTAKEFDAGHVPGAHRVDWTDNLAAGRVRDDGDLWKAYAACGLGPADRAKKTVVCYCTIGTRASVNVLVLERLGFERVLLYDGSWAEWTHADRPIEKSGKSPSGER